MLMHQRVGCNRQTPKCDRGTDGKNKPPVGGLRTGNNQQCCLNAIKEICWYVGDLFEKNHIKYWMDFGTLLGAVRGGEILPWDKDADFGVLAKDERKIFDLFGRIKRDGFWIDRPWRGLFKVYYSKVNLNFIDVFIWDMWSVHQPKKEEWKAMCMHNAIALNYKKFFPSYFIDRLDWVELNGKKLRAPQDYEKFLELRFGKDWRIPKRKWDDRNRIPVEDIQRWCEERGWRVFDRPVPRNVKPDLKMG
jgi:phosphorylcholine metabolism protein LicD